MARQLNNREMSAAYPWGHSKDIQTIKESMLDRYFSIHNVNFTGGILDGKEASYCGADYREAASG